MRCSVDGSVRAMGGGGRRRKGTKEAGEVGGEGAGGLDEQEEHVEAAADGVSVLAVSGGDSAEPGGAVEWAVGGGAPGGSAQDEGARALERVAEGDEVAVGCRRRAAACDGTMPECRLERVDGETLNLIEGGGL